MNSSTSTNQTPAPAPWPCVPELSTDAMLADLKVTYPHLAVWPLSDYDRRFRETGGIWRARDPAGFAAAQAAYAKAKAAQEAATQTYQGAMQRALPTGAAMRYPAP